MLKVFRNIFLYGRIYEMNVIDEINLKEGG